MNVHSNQSLQAYNTLSLQARCAGLVRVTSDAMLLDALEWARQHSKAAVPLGEGSNIVLAGDLDALVIRQATRGIDLVERGSTSATLRVAAGENWHQLVQWTLEHGFYGLENLALIPGTAGAAPIQNIGAYGVELQSVLRRVFARRIADGSELVLDREQCELAYRDSVFKHDLRDMLVITGLEIELALAPNCTVSYPALANYFDARETTRPSPQQVFDAVVDIRRSKLPDPAREPNAGSFFKNPMVDMEQAEQLRQDFPLLPVFAQNDGRAKLSAAWMIDQCGWKGYQDDRLGVHPQHALVLVNYGNDSGQLLLKLARKIAASVNETFGVQLDIEPRVYGGAP